jgi:hypothetical protein
MTAQPLPIGQHRLSVGPFHTAGSVSQGRKTGQRAKAAIPALSLQIAFLLPCSTAFSRGCACRRRGEHADRYDIPGAASRIQPGKSVSHHLALEDNAANS